MVHKRCYSHLSRQRSKLALLIILFIALALTAEDGMAGITEGGPNKLVETHSLGKIIQEAHDRPVHIIYVHGMRAEGPGASEAFRAVICKNVGDQCYLDEAASFNQNVPRTRLDIGEYPSEGSFLGHQIWTNEQEWEASRPFVDRYVYRRQTGGPIIVDEVNWWPLIFPLKCRFILKPEASLAGPDKDHLRLCARSDDPYHAWLTPDEVDKIIAKGAASGGGAWINAGLKQQIMDWGLSDAVLTFGGMSRYYRRAMEAAFEYVSTYEGKSVKEQEFVVISESLGSFAVMDAFANAEESRHVKDVLDETYYLYFFANQFALLELGRIEGLNKTNATLGSGVQPYSGSSALKSLEAWGKKRDLLSLEARAQGRVPRETQIIAFNDPSDILTFDVPSLDSVKVVNVYVKNAFGFFGLFENPSDAHTGYSSNKDVFGIMLAK